MRFGFLRVAPGGGRHGAEQGADIVEQPVGPGEFEECVDEDQDQPDAFHFPQGRRGADVDGKLAQYGQRIIGGAQKRQGAADREQAGGGKERGAFCNEIMICMSTMRASRSSTRRIHFSR